jgi:hypothetical protein
MAEKGFAASLLGDIFTSLVPTLVAAEDEEEERL